MNLHEDVKLFTQFYEDTAKSLNLEDAGMVEKDYFVTYFLQKIVEKQPGVIFKGGTSLSKCHKIIDRFSEDIDLNVNAEGAKLTEGQRKRLKQDVVSIIEESGFALENPDHVRSRRDFNRYIIDYHSSAAKPYLKQFLIVETAVYIKSFPTETMQVTSLIHDFFKANGGDEVIKQYGMEPFSIQVQSIERTFIDKVFAIADYYLSDNIEAHSRHIYDLYKLYPKIIFNDDFKELVKEVREVRKPHITCYSAKDDVDVPGLIQKIISEDVYKSDYDQITDLLLFDKIRYSEAVTVLQNILNDGCFA